MAGTKTISQFGAKTTPVSADLLYVGDSANSFQAAKSTIAQVASAITSNIGVLASNVIYVTPGASDMGATGSPIMPFGTVPAAYAAGVALAAPFTIFCAPGTHTFTDLALVENSNIVGSGPEVTTLRCTGHITADAARWQVPAVVSRGAFANLLLRCDNSCLISVSESFLNAFDLSNVMTIGSLFRFEGFSIKSYWVNNSFTGTVQNIGSNTAEYSNQYTTYTASTRNPDSSTAIGDVASIAVGCTYTTEYDLKSFDSNNAYGVISSPVLTGFPAINITGDATSFNCTSEVTPAVASGSPAINYLDLADSVFTAYLPTNYVPTDAQVKGHLQGIDNRFGGNQYFTNGGFNPTTYSTGTISQSGTTITGSGTTFTTQMVGGILEYTSGASQGVTTLITGLDGSTSISVLDSNSIIAGTTFVVHYGNTSFSGSNLGWGTLSNIYGAPTWHTTQKFPALNISNTSNQFFIGTTNITTLNFMPPSSGFTVTYQDAGTNVDAVVVPTAVTTNQLIYASSATQFNGLATANNGILVSSNTGVPSILAGPGATGRILQSNTSAAPSFSSASYPSSTTANQILYSSATNTVGGLTTANNAVIATNGSGVPSAQTNFYMSANNFVLGTSAGTSALFNETAVSCVAVGPFALNQVGSGDNYNTGVGYDALVHVSGGSENTGFGYGAGSDIIAGIANSCFGQNSQAGLAGATNRQVFGSNAVAVADNQVMLGDSNITTIVSGNTGGAVAIGTTANPYKEVVLGTTSTNNVKIAVATQVAARTYTLPDIGGNGSFAINGIIDVTGGSQTVAAGAQYWADKSTLTTFMLPVSPTKGDKYIIYGVGSGGWTVVYGSGQFINCGTYPATTTTTGSLSSQNQYDAVLIIAFSTTQFIAYPIQGNLTGI